MPCSQRPRLVALAVVLALLQWVALGCGAITGGTILLLLPRDDDDRQNVVVVEDEVAPAAFVDPVPRVNGKVPVVFRLVDPNQDPIDIEVEFSTNGGASFEPASLALNAGEGTTALSSSAAGTLHTFLWDAPKDLGPGAFTRVVVRITPSDAVATGAAGLSPGEATIGNDPPEVVVEEVVFEASPGNSKLARFTVTVTDSTSDLVDLDVFFEAAGLDLGGQPLTITGVATILAGDVLDLASDPDGIERSFVWNLVNDCRGLQSATISVAVTPSDGFESGQASTRGDIVWTRDQNPVGFIQPVPRQPTTVAAAFDLITLDAETTCAVEVFYEEVDPLTQLPIQGQGRFAPTLIATPVVALAAEPLGTRHALTWNAPLDLVTLPSEVAGPDGRAFVRIGIIPRDEQFDPDAVGFETFSNVFVIGNTAPRASIAPLGPTQGGVVPIAVTIEDDEVDAAALALQVSLAGGADGTFVAIPDDALVGARTQLATSAQGTTHQVFWNALRQLGLGVHDSVVIRATPSDTQPGVAVDSDAFELRITQDPQALVLAPLSGEVVSGQTAVRFRLFQVTDGSASVAVTFQRGALGTPADATALRGTATTGLATSIDGVEHVFLWDLPRDFPGEDAADVRVTVTPSDGAAIGLAGSSRAFKVNENEEPVLATLDVGAPDEAQGFRVPLALEVADEEGDAAAVALTFVFEQGLSITPALLDAGGLPLAGLSGVVGALDIFWDARTQIEPLLSSEPALAGVRLSNVQGTLRATPSDNADAELGNGAQVERALVLDLTEPPGITSADVLSGDPGDLLAGDIEIEATFVDQGGEDVLLVLEVAGDQQVTREFGPFTPSGPGVETTVTFTWPSSEDIFGFANVDLALRPRRASSGRDGASFALGNFDIENANEAEVTVVAVEDASADTGSAGVLRIRFLVRQPQEQSTTCAIEFAFEDATIPLGGFCRNFQDDQPADPDFVTDSSITFPADADGELTEFLWDTREDVGSTSGRVTVTVRPVDPPGSAGSISFDLDNQRAAEVVLGRDDPVSGPASARGFDLDAAGLATEPGVSAIASPFAAALARSATGSLALALPDPLNHRVLIWAPAPVESFRSANLVLGQPNFVSNGPDAGQGLPSALGLRAPAAVAVNEVPGAGEQRLAIADTGNHRVLLYAGIPAQSAVAAVAVLGQPDFETVDPTLDALDRMASPVGVALFEGGLALVVDKGGSGGKGRLLGFSIPPAGLDETVNGQAAALVDGDEVDDPEPLAVVAGLDRAFVLRRDPTAGPGSTTTIGVYTLAGVLGGTGAIDPEQSVGGLPDVTAPGTGLFLFERDSGSGPTAVLAVPYPAEDIVRMFAYDPAGAAGAGTLTEIPEALLGTVGSPGASIEQLRRPTGGAGTVFGFSSDDSQIAVIDGANHRVLLRDVTNDPVPLPFRAVLGQFDTFDANPNAELTTDASLYHPAGLVAFPTDDPNRPFTLIAADRGNHRVLIYGPSSAGFDGAPADVVIGQGSFTGRETGSGDGDPDPFRLSRPEAVAFNRNTGASGQSFHLFIADTGNGRVLRVTFGSNIFEIVSVEELITGLAEPCALHFDAGNGGGDTTEQLGVTPALYVVERGGGPRGQGSLKAFLIGTSGGGPATLDHTLDTVVTLPDSEVDLRGPNAVAILRDFENSFSFEDLLFLSDGGNDRVLVFTGLRPDPGNLRAVLGADGLGGAPLAEDDRRMRSPSGLFIDAVSQSVQSSQPSEGARVVVADGGNHRLLFFRFRDFLFNGGTAPQARDVLGQPGFFGRGANAGGRSAKSLLLDSVPGAMPHMGISGMFLNDGRGLQLFYADPGNGRALRASGELDLIDPEGTFQGSGS